MAIFGKKNARLISSVAILIFSFCISYAQDSEILPVGEFSKSILDNWVPKTFVGETRYRIVEMDGTSVLKADSLQSASGLIKKIKVDINKYPFLNWSWRIENQIAGIFKEQEKTGDDYAARIYVVISGGILVWNTKALNYVWAKHSSRNTIWPNAFAPDNARMIALRSSEASISTWYTEKRNIKKDFKAIFGKDVDSIDATVLMTDTDNTQKQVTAYYGDIFFSSK